ncbi:MAG: hypothetical protein EZS28_037673 [Streblomastix strix]|uniref:Uncharacterized protein n=1 Tax=Streblomastix strix TaxID=222440 RepID=A0A5J4U8W0_9EUKA|nr:MAG: hypothetical protein EZS28_037673 [Streblomastix strix]
MKLYAVQQNFSNYYLSNTREPKDENIEIYGRHNFNPPIKATTQSDDSGDHPLPLKPGLATLFYEMCNNFEEMLSISRLRLQNLVNGRNNDSDRKRSMKHKLKDGIRMTNESQIVTISNFASFIGEINHYQFQFPQISLWMNAINTLKTRTIVT